MPQFDSFMQVSHTRARSMIRINLANRNFLSNVSFYLGWWACAAGAKYGFPMAGPLVVLILSTIHLYFSPYPKGEMVFFMALFGLGFFVDSILIKLGLFTIIPSASFAPLWLVCMWVLMGMTFEMMLLFRSRIWLVCILGVIFGPLSYFWGEAFQILIYQRPLWASLAIHGLLWAVLTPLLYPIRDWALRISLPRH